MDYITRTIAQFINKLREADERDVPLLQIQIESLFRLQYQDKLEKRWRRIVYKDKRNAAPPPRQPDLFD